MIRLTLVVLLVATLGGCSSKSKTRARTVETPVVKDVPVALRGTIGAEATVRGDELTHVSGYGLVVGLNGTGGLPLNDRIAQTMERELGLRGISVANDSRTPFAGMSPREVLRDPAVAVVRVDAAVPIGAPAGATAPEPVRKRRWLVPAVLLVAAVAVAGVFSLRGGAQPKAKPTTGTSAVRVDGRAVTRVVYAGQDGGKPHGYFTQTAKGTWVEYDAGNDRSFTFRELNRNGDGVALRDDSRGITILLDLKRGLVQLRAGNAAPRPLYRIRSAQ